MGTSVSYPILPMNYEYSDDPEPRRSFIAVSSAYYPGLDDLYKTRIDEWLGSQEISRNEIDFEAFVGQFTGPKPALKRVERHSCRIRESKERRWRRTGGVGLGQAAVDCAARVGHR